VESFDVHEPFHVPEPYFSMYNKETGTDDFTVWPPYQDAKKQAAYFAKASEKELNFVRSQYAGKMTMVDKWFGHRWPNSTGKSVERYDGDRDHRPRPRSRRAQGVRQKLSTL
jgi:hypothetical protein